MSRTTLAVSDFRLISSEGSGRRRGDLVGLVGYCLRKCLGGIVVRQKRADVEEGARRNGGAP